MITELEMHDDMFLCGLVVVTAIRCLGCLVGMMLARIARDQCLVIDAKHFKIINENLSRFLTITQLTKLVKIDGKYPLSIFYRLLHINTPGRHRETHVLDTDRRFKFLVDYCKKNAYARNCRVG